MNNKPLGVLIIEDSEPDTELMLHELRRGGYEPISERVETLEAMEAALKRKEWDIILSDFNMPRFSAPAALEKLKESGLDLPFIVISGTIGESVAVSIMKSGASDYVMKDNLARLVPAVERELREAEGRRERRRADEALRESEEMYKALVNTSPDSMIITDLEGTITYASPRSLELNGCQDAGEMLGKRAFMFIAPEDHERAMINLQKTLDEGSVRNIEYRLQKKDGTRFFGEMSAALIHDAKGKQKAFMAVFRDITDRKQAEERLQQSLERIRKNMDEVVRAIALTVETRDPYTAGHQQRVARLAGAIARELDLSEDETKGVCTTGIVHDLGKIYVPSEILAKPGRLSAVEFDMIKAHPRVGYDILKTIEFPWPVADVVLQHHERMDGSGYPSGLSGKDILPGARIISVADVVEAMASHRPYRTALGVDRALAEIREKRGALYDSDVADACLEVFAVKGFKFD